MAMVAIDAALEIGKTLVGRIWPDPQKQAEEVRKLEELHQQGNLEALQAHTQLMLGQIETNKIEAGSKSKFIAGWRPAIGWVSTISLALAYVPKSIVITTMWTYQCYLTFHTFQPAPELLVPVMPVFPDLGLTDILGLLGAMLGIGGMRSLDKFNRVQTDNLK